MEVVFENNYGEIVHGDNLEVMSKIPENSVDSCISDFPYAIEFMGKSWDGNKNWHQGSGTHSEFSGTGYDGKKRPDFYSNTIEDKMQFYQWCYDRAAALYRIMKPGGYVAIFGHPKANHRMKCGFEDAGFKIVEEISWLTVQGMPKNQNLEKVAQKLGNNDLADELHGYFTAGLKPSHEPITIFQKPLEGTYINNYEKYKCGGMNIGACRVPYKSNEDMGLTKAKCNFTSASDNTRGFGGSDITYGTGLTPLDQASETVNSEGRFPPNTILDDLNAQILDEQTGIISSKSSNRGVGYNNSIVYGDEDPSFDTLRGYDDIGGGSRMFPIFKYCPKISPSERTVKDGTKNIHVTVKPVDLIKWLIRLLTPKGGTTIDITAGSCTHAVACEQLNYDESYDLNWTDIELMNTEEDPYCDIGIKRVKFANHGKPKRLF